MSAIYFAPHELIPLRHKFNSKLTKYFGNILKGVIILSNLSLRSQPLQLFIFFQIKN